MRKFNGVYTSELIATAPGTKWLFTNASTIVSADSGIVVEDTAADTHIRVDGRINARFYGVLSEADNATVTIEKRASLTAEAGVGMVGDHLTLMNFGEIHSSNYGLGVSGSINSLYNAGIIDANVGISAEVDNDSTIVNDRSGLINGQFSGISVYASGGTDTSIINRGTIISADYAVVGPSGDNRIINRGSMTGDIWLQDGDDVFDGRRGTLKGVIEGGGGNDTFIIDDAATGIIELLGGGTDTVRSSAGFQLTSAFEHLFLTGKRNIDGRGNGGNNLITGNLGDNDLVGSGGLDVISGGAGDDRLFGGMQQDVFVFGTDFAHDKIMNFQNGVDLINIDEWDAASNFQRVLRHTTEKNGNLIIRAGHDQLTIEGMIKAELDAGDFVV